MSWITIILSMNASACLTLALVYGFIWWRQRDAWAHLLFTLVALGTATLTACELTAIRSESTTQFALAMRWGHVSVWVIALALAGFVRLYLGAGRTWLLWTVYGLRTLSLLLNFLTGQNLNYREITTLHYISVLGESVPVPHGAPNPWMLVGHLSLLALMIFVADAAITAWRRGDGRRAVLVGGSIAFFVAAGAGSSALIFWGNMEYPLTPSLFFLGIVVVMAYELGSDTVRAAQLARDLSASEQRISLAAQAANLGHWVWIVASNEIWASDQWRALFGFTTSERLHLDDLLRRLHPNDRQMMRQTLENANQDDGRHRAEYRVVLPHGEMRWIASHGRVEFDSKGQPLRLHGVSLDVTHGKQADLEAQTHRNELAHLLRVESLGELSTALAHELNQPLTGILSNVQAAQHLLTRDKYDLEELREILRDIASADRHATDIILRMRQLLKRSEVRPERLEVSELIQGVLKLMNFDLNAHSVRVVTELTTGLPLIRGDRIQLQQVLINLILNANDAMAQTAESARTLTLQSCRAKGHFVEISVADTGIGLPPGGEEKIFDAYHTTKAKGLGLGLSLSRSIVRAHGGRLWAANTASGGAKFHCTIPEWMGDAQ